MLIITNCFSVKWTDIPTFNAEELADTEKEVQNTSIAMVFKEGTNMSTTDEMEDYYFV